MINSSNHTISLLNKSHNRKLFNCGNDLINNYLKKQASQDLNRGLAAVFVLEGASIEEIIAFYTLSSLSIDAGDLASINSKKLPSLRPIPCTLLGQFAVDINWQNKGVAAWLLVHIMFEVIAHAEKVGSYALVVDAIDETAKKYWLHCGFLSFPENPNRLFISMENIKYWLKG